MISYKKQKRLLWIPLINISILFIVAKYFVNYWQIKLFPYMIAVGVCAIPVLELHQLLDPYIQEWMKTIGFAWLPPLVFFYGVSLLGMGALLLAQKRLIREEYKELFYEDK